MKSYIVTFNYMVDADSIEDAVQEAVSTIVHAMRRKEHLPFIVQEDDGRPVVVDTFIGSDGSITTLPLTGEEA